MEGGKSEVGKGGGSDEGGEEEEEGGSVSILAQAVFSLRFVVGPRSKLRSDQPCLGLAAAPSICRLRRLCGTGDLPYYSLPLRSLLSHYGHPSCRLD